MLLDVAGRLGQGNSTAACANRRRPPATHLFWLSLSEPLLRDYPRIDFNGPQRTKGRRLGGFRDPYVVTDRAARLFFRANLLLERAKADVRWTSDVADRDESI